jgi:hypothetical protein
MQIHGRAKLGPAGRLALTQGGHGWDDVEAGRWALRRLGSKGSPLVASAVGCQLG